MAQILHMTLPAYWANAQQSGTYEMSTHGVTLAEQGFIHCSTAGQIGPVAQAVYGPLGVELVVLVLIDHEIRASGVPVRYEDGGNGELYPHIYGALDVSLVKRVEPAGFTSAGEFWWGANPEAN